jgi:phosphatidylethanolamine/phosphatidyl-N-methylethanolamine N-methyltransferase
MPLLDPADGFGRLFREQSRIDFRNVGAIAPSSRWLATSLAEGLASGPGSGTGPRGFLEVGAGTGPVTTALAAVIGPSDTLVVVEQNAAFAACLESRVATDDAFREVRDHVRVLHASVTALEPVPRFHAIISSLPFNNFTPAEVAGYLDLYRSLLVPGGEIRFFEYLGIRRLRAMWAMRTERERLVGVERVLRAACSSARSTTRIVWWNLPPAVVHILRP